MKIHHIWEKIAQQVLEYIISIKCHNFNLNQDWSEFEQNLNAMVNRVIYPNWRYP
jgi:hypothetical protein